MKKIIVKFWSVGLLLALLSTLFVGSAAPAAAANYGMGDSFLGPWSPATFIPGSTLAPVTNFGVVAVAQCGSTIYALAGNTTAGYFALEKSTDGGATWTAVATGIVPAAQTFNLIAVAPDDPNYVVIGDTAANTLFLSKTGGSFFGALGAPGVGALNDITISPLGATRYITVAGGAGLATMNMGLTVPAWVADATAGLGPVYAAEYSSNYLADAGLVAISQNTTGNVTIGVYSTNLARWNPTGYGFPIQINTSTPTPNVTKATITLDSNFYLGDATALIGFIGIYSTTATFSGIYRFDLSPTLLANQIYAAAGVNSIAWDGTNLMAGVYRAAGTGAGLSIVRSANALAGAPLVSWAPNSPYKTPGTGYNPLVLFNSGVGYAFSSGNNSAIAKTTNNGASFNGFALINSNFNNVNDFAVTPDGSVIYAVVNDGADTNVWKFSAGWTRVMTLAADANGYLVRIDNENPDTVYLGQAGGTTMYKSLDGGASWTIRASSAPIADFVVQDATTLYLTSTLTDALVYKSTFGAFTWTPVPTGLTDGGAGYSLTLIADNQVIMGSNSGWVAYTADGAAWRFIPAPIAAGNVVATAAALPGMIWAGSTGVASGINSWNIGTSVGWTNAALLWGDAGITGIVVNGGVVYAASSNATPVASLYRFLVSPVLGAAGAFDRVATGPVLAQGTLKNTLKVTTTASNIVWARAQNTYGLVDTLDQYADHLTSSADAPQPVYPINNTKINVNSLSGVVGNFVFQWNAPPALPGPPIGYTYNIAVFLDEAGTITVGNSAGVAASIGGVGVSYNQVLFNAGAGLNLQPGTAYFWQIRVWTPVFSYWSPMQSFTVQQLQAIVPTLSSPTQSAIIPHGQLPAFAWTPITGTATYKFQVSTKADFSTTIYDTTTPSAGAQLPGTVFLTDDTVYFWRVKSLTPTEGEWSTVGNFTVAAAPEPTTTSEVVTPTTIVTSIVIPPATSTVITVPPDVVTTTTVNPSYIWAIIIIGALLVIAVIVLIVRTRRSV